MMSSPISCFFCSASFIFASSSILKNSSSIALLVNFKNKDDGFHCYLALLCIGIYRQSIFNPPTGYAHHEPFSLLSCVLNLLLSFSATSCQFFGVHYARLN
ncbi:hypothetical protein RJT34_25169 [Clitoria ternatea]|uniref:Uncharacterized protein n=1 Tax=Clitoria ternatea TaxID=43366 RepID=A0AAN9FP90_CLITE